MSDIERGEGIARKFKMLNAQVKHIQRCEMNAFHKLARHWKAMAEKESLLFGSVQRFHLAGGHTIHIYTQALINGRGVIMAFVGQSLYYTLI